MQKETIDPGPGLRDERHGAMDPVTPSESGAPEGLKRERKGPLNPTTGRRDVRENDGK